VRGRDELEIVLNKTGKEKEEKYEQLARLDLALRFQQKPVCFLLFEFLSFLSYLNRFLSLVSSLLLIRIVNKSLWKYGTRAFARYPK
jgi:hypothetical protein